MTALWEAAMRKIHEAQMPLDAFLAATVRQLRDLVTSGKATGPLDVGGLKGAVLAPWVRRLHATAPGQERSVL
jgi:hypothetical protein